MNKPNFSTKIYWGRSLTLIKLSIFSLALIITISVPLRASENVDRKEIIHEIINEHISVADNQYQEGFYEDAAGTYIMAQKYETNLTEQERDQLNMKISKAQNAAIEQKKAMECYHAAKELYKNNKLTEAQSLLKSVKDNKFLTSIAKAETPKLLEEIDSRMKINSLSIETTAKIAKPLSSSEQVQTLIPIQSTQTKSNNSEDLKSFYGDLYNQSKAYDQAGQYEKARDGYVQVLNSGTIENKLVKEYIQSQIATLDKTIGSKPASYSTTNQNLLALATSETADNTIIQTQVVDSENDAADEQDGSYLDTVIQERDTIRTYIKTLIDITTINVNKNINQERFDQAKLNVEETQISLNQYKAELGDELFELYQTQLNSLILVIDSKEEEKNQQNQLTQNNAALQEQALLRARREKEEKQRIKDLKAGIKENIRLENFDAALGQIKSMLQIDPRNDWALTTEAEVRDMMYFKKQVDIDKEMNYQTAEILIDGDEARIPYAGIVTYPKNWREISNLKTRQPDKPYGIDAREEAVYQQLDEIVDLSDISQDMTFYDVLDKIKNAVEPPLQIQPNWRDLDEMADIQPTTLANMGPLRDVKLRAALDVLLSGLSNVDAPLGHVVREGVILIATEDTLPTNLIQRTYDIADLVGMPSMGGGGMMGGMMGGGMMGGMRGGMMGGGMMGGYGGGMMGGYGGGYGSSMMGGGYGNSYGGGYGNTGGYGRNTGYGNTGGYNSGYGSSMMGGGYGGGYGSSMMGGYGGGYGSSMMGGYGGGMMGGMGMRGGGMMGGNTSQELISLVMELIEPDSWYEMNEDSEGTMFAYPQASPKKLAVTNTPEVHAKIEKFLESMRQGLGEQVTIELRFLSVTENWLNDVGLDVDFAINAGGKVGQLEFQQGHYVSAQPEATGITGSLGAIGASMGVAGGYGTILDDLQVAFLLRATQARTDIKTLNAPRVTVLNGESATFESQEDLFYMLPPTRTTTVTPTGIGSATTTSSVEPSVESVQNPPSAPLQVQPIISHDKKYVIMNIQFQIVELLRIHTFAVDYLTDDGVSEFRAEQPETSQTRVMTRVCVPDRGTLLLGGQKLSKEVSKEAGVPILSKIPLLNRLFSNRTYIKDQKIILVLVRPQIVLQEESEAEALGEMKSLSQY